MASPLIKSSLLLLSSCSALASARSIRPPLPSQLLVNSTAAAAAAGISASAAAAASASAPPAFDCDYVVKAGEYCWIIAENHHVGVELFIKHNPQLDAKCSLVPGDKVRVPCVASDEVKPDTSGPCTREYVPRVDESCWAVSASQSVGPQNLRAWNAGLDDKCVLEAGKAYCVSHNEPVDCEQRYPVAPDDNCNSIAERIGKTTSYLVELNPDLLQPNCFLDPSYTICIKGKSEPAVPAVPAPAPAPNAGPVKVAKPLPAEPFPAPPANQSAEVAVAAGAGAGAASAIKMNLSVEVMAKVRSVMYRFVGNYTAPTPPRDAVILPPQAQVQEMVQAAARIRADAGDSVEAPPAPGSSDAHAALAHSASTLSASALSAPGLSAYARTSVSSQLLGVFTSASVSIQSSGCAAGRCALVATSKAEASLGSPPAFAAYPGEPASSGVQKGEQERPQQVPGRVLAEVRVGHVAEQKEEEEEDLACEVEEE